jgi:ribosomal protein S12 methylthiotransferase
MTSNKPITVGFFSLGCAKNLVDSQLMAGVLIDEGIVLAPSPEEADVVIVNTCCFVEDARLESAQAIQDACMMKQDGNCKAVLVAGCMSQRYKGDLVGEFPDVDAFLGLDELDEAAAMVKRIAGGETGVINVAASSSKLFEPRFPSLVLTGGPFAYLKIAEGCNHHCAFCAIPGIRGNYRSRPVSNIVSEAGVLLESGIRELNVISQDTTAYGRDLKDKTNLAGLVKELASLDGNFWIRLLYGYPCGVTDELLSVMAEHAQVCGYLDVPIQHSHPEILKAMQREDTIDKVANMTDRIRAALPAAAIRTTCLVGFPGETEEHFQHLLDHVAHARYDHLGVFVYSPEEDTKAVHMSDLPPQELAEERRDRLMLLQKEIVEEKNGALVGKEAEILLERAEPELADTVVGRSRQQAPEVDTEVYVNGPGLEEKIGTFIKVRYTEVLDYDLAAEPLSD